MRIEEEIKGHFKDEFHKAIVNIIYTHNSITEKLSKNFKDSDLTMQQFNVLRILNGQYPKPVSIGLIKERMLDKMSDTSRIVDRLLKKGLIEKNISKTDRRAAEIVISKTGLAKLNQINPKVDTLNENLSQKLTEKEAKLLNELLDKIR